MIGRSPVGQWELALPNTEECADDSATRRLRRFYWSSRIRDRLPLGLLDAANSVLARVSISIGQLYATEFDQIDRQMPGYYLCRIQ